jgi:hypothetical protein
VTDDLDRWPAIRRRVDPLPGGVFELRRRLREPRRVRASAVLAVAACAIVLAMIATWATRPGEPPDRRALHELLVDHPGAIALGLADPPAATLAADPRIADGVVVFRWVAP